MFTRTCPDCGKELFYATEKILRAAQIVGICEKDVKIGDCVEMVFRKIMEDSPEGLIHYGYKFRLCRKKSEGASAAPAGGKQAQPASTPKKK